MWIPVISICVDVICLSYCTACEFLMKFDVSYVGSKVLQ